MKVQSITTGEIFNIVGKRDSIPVCFTVDDGRGSTFIVDADGRTAPLGSVRFSFVKEDVRPQSWKFKTSVPIDFEEVFGDLSRAKPFGLVQQDNGKAFLAIYKGIAVAIGMETNTDIEYDKFTIIDLGGIENLAAELGYIRNEYANLKLNTEDTVNTVSYPQA